MGGVRRQEDMGCERCDAFDTEVAIPTPEVLRTVVQKVREAVQNGTLSYSSFESSRELIGQQSFMELDMAGPFPDVIRYHFGCQRCGNCYGLFVETYHGSGGKWFCLGKLPSNRCGSK